MARHNDKAGQQLGAALLGLLLLLSSCTTSPRPPSSSGSSFLQLFDDAAMFVPDDMDSIWLSDWRAPEIRGFRDHTPHLELWCGRDHGNWPGWTHRQTFVGVRVEDYGKSPIPAARRDQLGDATDPIAGAPMWHKPEHKVGVAQITPATWATIIDNRFIVIADSKQLMRDALARRRGSIVADMVRDMEIPADSLSVVYHQIDRFEVEWHGLLLATTPPRAEWWGIPEEPDNYSSNTPLSHDTRRGTDVWHVKLEGDGREASMHSWLGQATAFGLMIFI